MKSIEIDDDLYAFIASQTKHIGESASEILRRLLLPEDGEIKGASNASLPDESVQSAKAPVAAPLQLMPRRKRQKRNQPLNRWPKRHLKQPLPKHQ